MAKLSQIQSIKLSQNIALTPQLIQAIKLFELNNIELEEYIDREIKNNIEYGVDYKIGYPRTEVKCSNCGGHLGHMFNDGPSETTGKRHCINGAALIFIEK